MLTVVLKRSQSTSPEKQVKGSSGRLSGGVNNTEYPSGSLTRQGLMNFSGIALSKGASGAPIWPGSWGTIGVKGSSLAHFVLMETRSSGTCMCKSKGNGMMKPRPKTSATGKQARIVSFGPAGLLELFSLRSSRLNQSGMKRCVRAGAGMWPRSSGSHRNSISRRSPPMLLSGAKSSRRLFKCILHLRPRFEPVNSTKTGLPEALATGGEEHGRYSSNRAHAKGRASVGDRCPPHC